MQKCPRTVSRFRPSLVDRRHVTPAYLLDHAPALNIPYVYGVRPT
jgi:hypothetical protein